MTTRPRNCFVSRLGGKHRIANKILKFFPQDYKKKTYVEPFIGGGSLFWRKGKVENEIVNDLNTDFYHLWIDMKSHGDVLETVDFNKGDKKYYEELKTQTILNPPERLYRNLYISKWSYGGKRAAWVGEKEFDRRKSVNVGAFVKKYGSSYKQALSNVKIYNEDYKVILQKYDSPDTFFYLDPPYSQEAGHATWNYTKLYAKETLKPKDVYEAVKNLKGQWVLSYDDTPEIRDIFKDYNIHTIQSVYSIAPKKLKKDMKELVICNFGDTSLQ